MKGNTIVNSVVYAIFFLLLFNTIGTYFPSLGQMEILIASLVITVIGAGLFMTLFKGGMYIIIGLIIIQLFLFIINGDASQGIYIIESLKGAIDNILK